VLGLTRLGVLGLTRLGVLGLTRLGVLGVTRRGVLGLTRLGVLGVTRLGVLGLTRLGVLGRAVAGVRGVTERGWAVGRVRLEVAELRDVVGRTGRASAPPVTVRRVGVTRCVVAVVGVRVGVAVRRVVTRSRAPDCPALVAALSTASLVVTLRAGVVRAGCWGKLRRLVVAVLRLAGLVRLSGDATVGVSRLALDPVLLVAGVRPPAVASGCLALV
jgi:hypothetical protein